MRSIRADTVFNPGVKHRVELVDKQPSELVGEQHNSEDSANPENEKHSKHK